MTHDFNEETLLPFGSTETSADSPSSAPARKRAVKKTAAKKTAKVAAIAESEAPAKPAAKKAAVKKVAKKKAAAEDSSTPLLPVAVPAKETATPAPKEVAAAKEAPAAAKEAPAKEMPAKEMPAKEMPAKVAAKRASKTAKAVVPQEVSAPEPPREAAPRAEAAGSNEGESGEARKTFGRVPGGGPIQREPRPRREHQEPREPQEPRGEADSHEARDRDSQSAGQREQRQPQGGNPSHHHNNPQQATGDSRSKRRRDKRKRRRDRDRDRERPEGGGEPHGQQQQRQPHQQQERRPQQQDQGERRAAPFQFTGPKTEVDGMLELAPKGFGFLRVPSKRFDQARDDVFVPPEAVRKYGLRVGHWIHGIAQEGPRGPQLVEITSINGLSPEESRKLPLFEELKAINPGKRISFETTPDRYTTRVVDIMAPVGRGQRGLIVSPPRSGKTTLMLHMAEAVREKYDESLHLMIVLVDERPEEVTEFRRALPGVEIYASSNDDGARSHCRIAELAIERAKRLVEGGKDVFLLMDSITRLARAYNHGMGGQRGRGIASGGLTVGALEIPRRLFAAARNTRGGGSLTILATALIQTNSKADEAIFQEFKGTGNMELVLDRKIAENYIYPAVDIFKSGTRREELLLAEHSLHKIHLIRRGLAGHRPVEAMERLLFFLKKFPNNPQMLMEIKG